MSCQVKQIFVVFIGLGFIFQLGHFSNGCATDLDDVRSQIVKITAYRPGNFVETGGGIILATQSQKIFIMTTYHLIEEADRILVQFHAHPEEMLIAKPIQKYDEENDLAVITIEDYGTSFRSSPLHLGKTDKVKEGDAAFAIGHPLGNDWALSEVEILSSEDYYYCLSSDAVDPEYAGGALLNDKFQLIGMITPKSPGQDFALEIDFALSKLEDWQVPHSFGRSKSKWPWIAAGVAGAAVITIAAITLYPEKEKDGETGFPIPPGRP